MSNIEAPLVVSKHSTVHGPVGHISGAGSNKHTARVTAFEMELLCRHWAGQMRQVEEQIQRGPSDTWYGRMHHYVSGRLGYFGEILGEEKLREILDDVFDGDRTEVHPGAEHANE